MIASNYSPASVEGCTLNRRGDRAVEGARLEIVCAVNPAPRVRIPPSPPLSRILIEHSDFSNDRKRVGSNSVDSRDVDC